MAFTDLFDRTPLALPSRHGLQDGEAFGEILLERFTCTEAAEPAEDEVAAEGNLDFGQPGVEFVRRLAEQLAALWDSDGPTFPIVLPVMEATDDRAISLVGVAQRKRAMSADILESTQLLAEALHEDRARGQ
nr:hypothetical protein [Reyranella sp.]